jgi:hypothetical protein
MIRLTMTRAEFEKAQRETAVRTGRALDDVFPQIKPCKESSIGFGAYFAFDHYDTVVPIELVEGK